MPAVPNCNHTEATVLSVLEYEISTPKAIKLGFETRTKKEMQYGSLYVLMRRMIEKKLVKPKKQGNRVTHYVITDAGMKALVHVRRSLMEETVEELP